MPQPPVPSSIATGLRDPYMSLCQRGSMVSSAPRRSNCTLLFAPVLALFCGPRPALAHAEHRMLVEPERQRAIVGKHDFLYQLAGGIPDDERQRIRPHLDGEAADLPLLRASDLTQAQRRRRVLSLGQRRVVGKVVLEADGLERDADALVARDADVELRGLSGRGDLLCRRGPAR